MKAILTTGWNFMRVLRIVIGIWALYFAFRDHDTITGIAGALILLTGVFNTGCCAGSSCVAPPLNSSSRASSGDDASFEEIK